MFQPQWDLFGQTGRTYQIIKGFTLHKEPFARRSRSTKRAAGFDPKSALCAKTPPDQGVFEPAEPFPFTHMTQR
jgi:hypothetical protein